MRSEKFLSRVTRSCRESLPVWSNSVYGSRSRRPRTHCAGEYSLSPMAELPAQVTAVMSHVTRCIWSATNLVLNSSINRLARVFQTPPCRSQTAFCCGVMAAVGMSSPPWSCINLRGTPKGVIQCLKKWSQTIFGCLLGTMAMTPKVLARMSMKLNWLPAKSASTNKTMAAVPSQTLCLCEVVQGSGVQDDADSTAHRIAVTAQIWVHVSKTRNQLPLFLVGVFRLRQVSGSRIRVAANVCRGVRLRAYLTVVVIRLSATRWCFIRCTNNNKALLRPASI